jgi:hypothetical protein
VTLRVDVSDIHALIALVCGAFSLLFTLGCLVGFINDKDIVMAIAMSGTIAVSLWCGLFALVLRGTLVTRVAAVLGLVGAGLAVVVGGCAAAFHWA